ncbi:restriction endonuclease subunit S [Anabaena minutissima FACHB-250]|nr:restriction endonuclease subunit S [Anabaena minutissima FACHB-250]
MKIERYQAYRNSDIEWLGDVPEHWELSRIKQKGTVRGRVGWKALKADEYVDEGYIFLSTPNIKEKDIDFENVNYITYERYVESPEIMLQEGDILLTKDGSTLGTTNIVSSLPREATVNSSIAVVRFSKEVFKKYIYYQILSEFIQNKISFKKSGMGVPHLFQRDINNFFILLPPLSEQKSIAHYLDTKTVQIDRKIDLLTQKATLYGKLKQSLINETVTRGLDKSVPMKNSEIEWIGELPERWEEKRIKDLSFLQSGNNITSEQIEDEGEYPVYGGNGLRGYFSKYTNDGDYILIGRQGALCGNINYASGKFWATEHAVVVYLKQSVYMKWYGEMLKVINLNQYSISAAQPGLSVERIKRLLLPVPPLCEQKAIADYLDTKTTQFDQIIQTINTQIEKLKELRKTLINDVVTGKIKVTDHQ